MTVEELQVLMTANTDELRKEIQNVKKEFTNLQKDANKTSTSMLKSFNFLKKGIIALGIGKLVASQMDDAISRLDALNNFPKVMSNLGVSNEDAQASMRRLSDALIGLPTTLDSATQSVQRFTSANGNVKASTEMFLALNNAILAGGASTEIQKSALEQLSQAYTKGKPDMMEWRTAMSAMPAQLKQVAIAMGYASSNELGEALRSGKVSMDEFMVKITQLNKQGQNGFKSFEEQARNSTGGVGTSITNLKTAFTRGLAEIMNAIGQSNIASFFNGIASAINKVIPYITGFVKACVWAVSSISSLFGKSTKKDVDSTSKSLSTLGSTSGGSTAKGLDKATKSANGLKKALNGLASFDEMNVLRENTSSSGSSGDDASTGGGGGSIAGIDLSAFDTDIGNVSSKTDEIFEKVKTVFGEIGTMMSNIWSSEPMQAYVEAFTTYVQFIWDFWATIGTNLITNISTTWENIKGNMSITLGNMTKLWTTFWTDINAGIKTWGKPIIEGVSGVFNSIWNDAIDPVIQLASKGWADFSQILVDLWNEHGKPLIDNIGEFATKTIALFKSIWDNVIEPIIKPFLETLSWLWDKHLKGMIQEVGNFIMKLINGALEIYNKFIAPVVMWILDKLRPAFELIGTVVSNVFGNIVAFISGAIKSITKILGGVIDFITGIFTGNWKKAWQGVQDIFKGIIDAIATIFKAPINFIIDGINLFIRGLNKIKIPDWVPVVGGKGFHIEPLQKLAQGGVVDKPTTAVIGEAGREAVLPLENNTGWITELAEQISNANGGGQPIQLVVKIGEDTILNKLLEGINQKSFENNGEVFNL